MHSEKVVLVVGASSGFGKMISEKLLDKGFIVYCGARRTDKMEDLLKKGAKILSFDVTDTESVSLGVKTIIDNEGKIDIVYNNAGYANYGTIEEVSENDVKRQFDVNVFGVDRVNKAVLPYMREKRSGTIVITSSLASNVYLPALGWYTSTKHAIKAMALTLKMEVEHLGINIVLIEPGAVSTEFNSVAIENLNNNSKIDDYKDINDGFTSLINKQYNLKPGPLKTVDLMVKAGTTNKPKVIYRTTTDAKILPVLSKLITTTVLLKITLSLINKARKYK